MMDSQTTSAIADSAEPVNRATKKHLRGSTLLLAGRVISLATNFAIQVLTVRYLSKGDYGAFAYALQLVSIGVSFTTFGFDKTITRFVPIYQEKSDYNHLFGTIILMVATILSLGFFLVVLIFGLQGWVVQNLIRDQLVVSLLLIMVFLAPVTALDSLLLGLLAIFASPRSIFFRRHVLGPGLRLSVVLMLMFNHSDARFLAAGYLVAGTLGVVLYTGVLINQLRNLRLLEYINLRTMVFPIKEIFAFSIPLLTTNLVLMVRISLAIVMLEYFISTTEVASFRAVLPVAGLTDVVRESFTFLFMPLAARLFAQEDQKGIVNLYWQSAIWIAVLSFPIFIVLAFLAQPLTVLLFGERYAQSAIIMVFLSLGYYFNAALGFNSEVLRVFGKIRYIVAIDFLAVFISFGLNLYLIPSHGAVGAGIAFCSTMIIYNLLNHAGLKLGIGWDLVQRQYLGVYSVIVLSAVGVMFIQWMFPLPVYVGLGLATLACLLVFGVSRKVLDIEATFPELLRFRLLRRIFSHK